jgi:hypothetical protein
MHPVSSRSHLVIPGSVWFARNRQHGNGAPLLVQRVRHGRAVVLNVVSGQQGHVNVVHFVAGHRRGQL